MDKSNLDNIDIHTTVTIKIHDKKIDLTLEEANQLYNLLKTNLGKQDKNIDIPYWYAYHDYCTKALEKPFYTNPEITCSTNQTTTISDDLFYFNVNHAKINNEN